MPYSALAQYIEFFKPDLLCHIHIPLCCLHTFRGHIQSCVPCDRVLGYQHSAGMDTSLVRKIHDFLTDMQDLFRDVIFVQHIMGILYQLVDLLFGQAVYLAQFTDNRTVPES